MAESIVKLIVDATQGIRSLGRFKKATDEAAKKTDLLKKAVRLQKAATEAATTKLAQFGDIAKSAFDKASKAAQKYQSALGGIKGAIVSLGVAALTKRMIGQAASFAQTQVRLKALSTEYGEFGKIQQLVKDNAKTFNLSQAESASQFSDIYARLRPLGKTLEEVQTVYKGFNATAIASGTSAAAASGAFLQLSQALGSGRLQGDEFRSVSEQIPGILGLVADEMGVTVGELKKLGSEGAITSDILINALAKGFEKNKDKIQQILAESPAAKFKEFSNATSELSNAIGTELLPVVTPAVQELTKLLKAAGDLPGPIKTAGAALVGLSAVVLALASPVGALLKGIAAFAPAAAGATSAAKLLAGAMVILKGAMLALPWVAAAAAVGGLIALTVNYYKEQSDLNSLLDGSEKEMSKYETAIKKTNDKLAEAKSKLNNMETAGIGNARAIQAQKKRAQELKSQLEGIKGTYTARVQVLLDIQKESENIAGIDYKPDGPSGRLVPINPPETVTQERERKAQELKDRLANQLTLSGGSGTGSTAKGPDPVEEARKLAQLSRDRVQALENQALLASAVNETERKNFQLNIDIAELQKNAKGFAQEDVDAQIAARIALENKRNEAEAYKKTIAETAKEEADSLAKFLSDFDAAFQELDAKAKAQADKMDALYASIGQTISTSIVDSLTAAVDGTKRLSDVASDTLRSLANILLKFGLNSLLSGLGGDDGVGVFSKLFGGRRAKGGTVMGGTSYMVGERGPELYTPGRSGSIAPNSSIGGGANVVVNVDASGTKAEGDGRQANQLGAALGAAVQAELIKQKRPGGLLAA